MSASPAIPMAPAPPQGRWPVVFAYGFRILFVLGSGWAVGAMLPWLAFYVGWWEGLGGGWVPHLWHGHEMVFAFAGAVMGGFLLTATPNWTGTNPRRGSFLVGVAAAWLVGRIAGLVPHPLAPWVGAVADLGWIGAVAWAAAHPLWRHGVAAHRIFPPLVLACYVGAELLVRLEWLGWAADTARRGLYLGVDTLVMLMVVIGGRLLPRFTAMAMQNQGVPYRPEPLPRWVESLLLSALLLLMIGDAVWLDDHPRLAGGAALVAAVLLVVRMGQWHPGRTWRTPMVGILHLGFVWLVIGLALRGVAAFSGVLLPSTALHAITVGAMGTLMVGVMTRVCLAHTGQPLAPPRRVLAGVFWLVPLAGLLRSVVAVVAPPLGIHLGGVLWLVGFTLFITFAWPLLLRPRADGMPG